MKLGRVEDDPLQMLLFIGQIRSGADPVRGEEKVT